MIPGPRLQLLLLQAQIAVLSILVKSVWMSAAIRVVQGYSETEIGFFKKLESSLTHPRITAAIIQKQACTEDQI